VALALEPLEGQVAPSSKGTGALRHFNHCRSAPSTGFKVMTGMRSFFRAVLTYEQQEETSR
jgi:hypothetical protein